MKIIRTQETEAMQWTGHAYGGCRASGSERCAEHLVAWVNANGGEARYEPSEYIEHDGEKYFTERGPRIMVRTSSGWAPVAPDWWVIKGSETFDVTEADFPTPHTYPVLDYYPCDPDTFEREGWQALDG